MYATFRAGIALCLLATLSLPAAGALALGVHTLHHHGEPGAADHHLHQVEEEFTEWVTHGHSHGTETVPEHGDGTDASPSKANRWHQSLFATLTVETNVCAPTAMVPRGLFCEGAPPDPAAPPLFTSHCSLLL